jgi:hypothetical protein
MELAILPLAVTMMAGPQILSAIILVTTDKPIETSLAFVAGVAVATTVGLILALWIAGLIGDSVSLGDSDSGGSTGNIIQYVLVGLLVLKALKNWRDRATVEPPAWLGKLMGADWKQALKTGTLMILVMPSDILVMLTVAINIEHARGSLVDAIPFILATVLIAGLPMLGFILFHRRAQRAMPVVRDWMNANSWLINIIFCGIFILLIL